MAKCKRCMTTKDARNYGVAIFDAEPDSRDEGLHIADWELLLCDECTEVLEEKLELFLRLTEPGS